MTTVISDIKFAVVREDPQPEIDCALQHQAKHALLVASGGCTAFALQHQLPDLTLDLFDINPHQLQHVANRARALHRRDYPALNIGDANPKGLSQCGVFEKFFRIFRHTLTEFVASPDEVSTFFQSDLLTRRQMLKIWQASSFWESLFHICFNDDFLVFLFGQEAIQNANKNSYIDYFRQRFERGLYHKDSNRNYFLHSIFLGHYQKTSAPPFLTSGGNYQFNAHAVPLTDMGTIDHFDLISLSNILDWCDQTSIVLHANKLMTMRPGSTLILRQLNNKRSLRPLLEPAFSFDDALSHHYQATDRSLFYNTIEIATRTTLRAQQ